MAILTTIGLILEALLTGISTDSLDSPVDAARRTHTLLNTLYPDLGPDLDIAAGEEETKTPAPAPAPAPASHGETSESEGKTGAGTGTGAEGDISIPFQNCPHY